MLITDILSTLALAIIDKSDHLLFLLLCILFFNLSIYGILHLLLSSKNNKYNTLPYHKKLYVLKNLTKSMLLCVFGFGFTPTLIRFVLYNQADDWSLTNWGCLYISTDMTGLLFVPKLPLSTKIHHICVTIIGFIAIFSVDFNTFGIHHAFFYLTYFSVIPYVVNTLLAFRFIAYPQLNLILAKLGLIIYIFSVICNCSSQYIIVAHILEKNNHTSFIEILVHYGFYLLNTIMSFGLLIYPLLDFCHQSPEKQVKPKEQKESEESEKSEEQKDEVFDHDTTNQTPEILKWLKTYGPLVYIPWIFSTIVAQSWILGLFGYPFNFSQKLIHYAYLFIVYWFGILTDDVKLMKYLHFKSKGIQSDMKSKLLRTRTVPNINQNGIVGSCNMETLADGENEMESADTAEIVQPHPCEMKLD